MLQQHARVAVDEGAAELIAARVTAALREDIQALLAAFTPRESSTRSLTVEQLAAQLGVARSTVYAHWREWGGYKLGAGEKAPIRFDQDHLPSANAGPKAERARKNGMGCEPHRKRGRRDQLITDAPRLLHTLDELA